MKLMVDFSINTPGMIDFNRRVDGRKINNPCDSPFWKNEMKLPIFCPALNPFVTFIFGMRIDFLHRGKPRGGGNLRGEVGEQG